jgi:hypothetical protein
MSPATYIMIGVVLLGGLQMIALIGAVVGAAVAWEIRDQVKFQKEDGQWET